MSDETRETKTKARRRRLLFAARTGFEMHGGLSAGLCPIAAAGGCTTGAIYASFSSKEEIYAALLEESLGELSAVVAAAVAREASPDQAFRAATRAFFEYYQSHLFEFRLGLYLFEPDGRTGLGSERDAALNDALNETIEIFTACFERLAASSRTREHSPIESAHSLFPALIGALTISRSRRDQSLQTDARKVLDVLIDLHLA